MLRRNLCASIAVCIVVPLSTFSQNAQPRTDTPQTLPVIRSTTRAVNVTVVVTDRKGQPVQGLTKNDFQIFDNGHPETIGFFSTRKDQTTGSYALRELPPGEYTNDPSRSGLPDEGATVILFDTVNTNYLSQAYSLGRIRTLLRHLRPEDRIGVYVLNEDGLKVVYDLNQPASTLLEAMKRYDEAHRGGAGSRAEAAVENSTGLVELDRFLRGKHDREPERRYEDRLPITLAAFQEIARLTVALRGRKAVIWVTDNPPFSPLPVGLRQRLNHLRNNEFDLLVRLFNQDGIALYPMSAEGLQTVRLFGPAGMDSTAFMADQERMTEAILGAVDAVANTEAHQEMEAMARRTGGRAYYDRNDLETGIRRALDDAKHSYELAYYPDHDEWNGDWRKIEVKVNRPGVIVLARAGYYAFPEPKLLPPKASKQLIEEIAASPLEDTEIPITVKLTPPGRAGSAVEARVYLSAKKLFTSHAVDEWTSNFEVLFFQLTAKNKILDVATQDLRLAFAQAKYSEALKRGINTEQQLKFKPGAAVLYVIVHDKTTDAVGSVRIPLREYSANPAPN